MIKNPLTELNLLTDDEKLERLKDFYFTPILLKPNVAILVHTKILVGSNEKNTWQFYTVNKISKSGIVSTAIGNFSKSKSSSNHWKSTQKINGQYFWIYSLDDWWNIYLLEVKNGYEIALIKAKKQLIERLQLIDAIEQCDTVAEITKILDQLENQGE